ncbi:tyrosine-type recombinase/integrase, partial [Paenibacillus sp. FSL H7-0326]
MEFVEPIRDKKKIEAMKKVLKGSNMRDYCLFVLGINSGLRISDILNLRIDDVVDVNRKLKERIIIKEKKTGKPKDFPINESTGKAIREYLDTRL